MKIKVFWVRRETKSQQTWHRWFAWYPVRVSNDEYRWLEMVYRRGEYNWIELRWKYEYAVRVENT